MNATEGLTNALNGIYAMREDWDGDWTIRDYTVYNGYFMDLISWMHAARDLMDGSSPPDAREVATLYALTASDRLMDVVRSVVFDNNDLISRLHLISESKWYDAKKALDEFKVLYLEWREVRRMPERIHWMKKSYLMCDDNLGGVMEFLGIGPTTKAEFIKMVYA